MAYQEGLRRALGSAAARQRRRRRGRRAAHHRRRRGGWVASGGRGALTPAGGRCARAARARTVAFEDGATLCDRSVALHPACYPLARADEPKLACSAGGNIGQNGRFAWLFVTCLPPMQVRPTRSLTRRRPTRRPPARESNVHAEEPPHERTEGVQGGRVRGGPRLLQAYAAAGSNPGRAYPRRPSVGAGGAPSASSASASLAQACSSHRCSSLLTGALRTEDGEQSALVHLTFAVSGAAHVVSQPGHQIT